MDLVTGCVTLFDICDPARDGLYIKTPSCQHRNSSIKISRSDDRLIFFSRNPHTSKDGLYIEIEPRFEPPFWRIIRCCFWAPNDYLTTQRRLLNQYWFGSKYNGIISKG